MITFGDDAKTSRALPDFPLEEEVVPAAVDVLTESDEMGLWHLTAAGIELLGVTGWSEPSDVADAVDQWIRRLKREGESVRKDDVPAVAAAYGHAVVQATAWRWNFYIWQGTKQLALCSPDKAHVHLPVAFISQQVQPRSEVTALLLFNMIVAGNLPTAAEGSLNPIG